jgi:hypothetical protein
MLSEKKIFEALAKHRRAAELTSANCLSAYLKNGSSYQFNALACTSARSIGLCAI